MSTPTSGNSSSLIQHSSTLVSPLARSAPPPPPGWPEPPSDDAFQGLMGQLVRMIEPQSESDAVGLLVQGLVAFGNVIGRGPHFMAEADRHALNLFVVLVGESSKAR